MTRVLKLHLLVHLYPEEGSIDQAIKALRAYEIRKPLIVEEMFPLKCSIDELGVFVRRSSSHVDGWISFYWGETTAELQAKDRDTIKLSDTLTANWLNRFTELSP